ncbi:MAG TPA: DUF3795 domain-containing protein [Syntrophales bacterium]|nr:DUF3795 domain-containing protein [Syntrophales bacterium]HOM06363.1 DUF3795 domain-containing protein [Syntrophales bacterium]HON99186.1 DUF3795 domain-containing protein [Syntrophales bacterium]HPC00294.1 DUF3795 domain-containing protein [Syntrophales bacterium]HPQ05957.1 DUF3795 domain-containing protein [Syntrophales bacterium]
MEKEALAAPCGLDCFNCELYEGNLTEKLAEAIHKKLGVPKEDVPCRGCRGQDGIHFHLPPGGCATLACVKARGVLFCHECADFPCPYLAPTADQANRYPHNMKVYNLCRIRKVGLRRWIDEEAAEIRRRYFTGPFVVGKGQAD